MFCNGEKALAVDLRTKRKAAGLTAEELSEILDCDPKHVIRIELGYCGFTIPKAAKAAKRLGPLTVDVEGVGRVVIAPVNRVHESIVNYGLVA